jgi:hypothetical protein
LTASKMLDRFMLTNCGCTGNNYITWWAQYVLNVERKLDVLVFL